MKVLVGVLMIAHGLVHGGLAAAPNPNDPDAKPLAFFTSLERSRILNKAGTDSNTARRIGLSLEVLSLIGFLLAGIGLLTDGVLNDL